MMHYRRTLATSVLALLCAQASWANGINPPRPSGGTVVEVECTRASSSHSPVVMKRAQIVDQQSLTLKSGGQSIDVKLIDIKSLQFDGTKVDRSGFRNATFDTASSLATGTGQVLVAVGKKAIFLKGFDNAGARVEVRISDCAKLAVRTSGDAESIAREAAERAANVSKK